MLPFFRSRPAFAAGFRPWLPVAGPALLALGLLAGCMNPPANDASRIGPFFTPTNHLGDPVQPAGLRRVVLMPLAGEAVAPAASLGNLDPVVSAALLRQNRFEVIALSREACLHLFGAEEFSSVEALPANFMAVLRREYTADGVLLVDVTAFQGFRPLMIGLRAKLATLQDVRLVWSFDTLFSAADATVANSARRHALDGSRSDVPADFTPAALQSPSQFMAYAADAMFATLPPLSAPPSGAKPAGHPATH